MPLHKNGIRCWTDADNRLCTGQLYYNSRLHATSALHLQMVILFYRSVFSLNYFDTVHFWSQDNSLWWLGWKFNYVLHAELYPQPMFFFHGMLLHAMHELTFNVCNKLSSILCPCAPNSHFYPSNKFALSFNLHFWHGKFLTALPVFIVLYHPIKNKL